MAADHIREKLEGIVRESFANVPDPMYLILELASVIGMVVDEFELPEDE